MLHLTAIPPLSKEKCEVITSPSSSSKTLYFGLLVNILDKSLTISSCFFIHFDLLCIRKAPLNACNL